MTQASQSTGTQAVDRAAHLVALVVRSSEGLGFTELQDETGFARSTTSRLLTALERSGLLGRDDEGRFVAGSLFDSYAARGRDADDIARLGRPAMEALGELTGETVNIGVPRHGTVVHIGQVASTYIVASRDWVDVEVPPYLSALGKVLYAGDALDLPRGTLEHPTPHAIASVGALRKQLTGIRETGYGVTVDELEVGLTGVAAPVRIGTNTVAALGISGPSARLANRLDSLGPLVAHHASQLSSQITRHRKDGAA